MSALSTVGAIASEPEVVTTQELNQILNFDVNVKKLSISFASGVEVEQVWNYIAEREYGSIGDHHTNVPQGFVWMLRELNGKGSHYAKKSKSVRSGEFDSPGVARDATALAPTNVTAERVNYLFSLSQNTRGGQRFAQLLLLLGAAQASSLESMSELEAFRISEFASRLQLASVLTNPIAITDEESYKKFWRGMQGSAFHVRNNDNWIPLDVTIMGTDVVGFGLQIRTFRL